MYNFTKLQCKCDVHHYGISQDIQPTVLFWMQVVVLFGKSLFLTASEAGFYAVVLKRLFDVPHLELIGKTVPIAVAQNGHRH